MPSLGLFSAARDGLWRESARGCCNVARSVVVAVAAPAARDIAGASARGCPQRGDFGSYVWYSDGDEGAPLGRCFFCFGAAVDGRRAGVSGRRSLSTDIPGRFLESRNWRNVKLRVASYRGCSGIPGRV
jgi:hypothetical protein